MTSCSSSVSVPLKSTNANDDHRSKSCDSVCTTNSSCILQRRKPKNPLMYANRTSYPKFTPTSNTVKQRVMSAKLLKLRSLQSQLNDANYHVSELTKENQTLKNLQKRQDKALSKYENSNADLPRLIRGHEEQIRILTEKNKTQRSKIRELAEMLKTKEEDLLRSQERTAHLDKLTKDKRLVDKEKLLEQIEEYKLKLQKAEEFNSILNRKLAIETKISKQRLNTECMRHKSTHRELTQALTEINRLTSLLESKNIPANPKKNRFTRLQSVSMINLGTERAPQKAKKTDKLATIEDDVESLPDKTPVSNVKLEPIRFKNDETIKKSNGILDSPSENIKNRLSSGGSKSRESGEDFNSSGEDDNNFGALSNNGSEVSLSNYLVSDENKPEELDDSDSLEKINPELDAAFKKAEENVINDFNKKVEPYCKDVLHNAREATHRVNEQKESLIISKKDTNVIIEAFEKTQKLEDKLNNSFLNFDPLNDDFLKSFLTEKKADQNGNEKKDSKFGEPDRKKLLNTLKAIDDGDSFDFDEIPSHKNFSRGMNQLVG
ncbi:unnamed protein product [Phyllotreta striolata]|uniref:Lebercilin domain-containing protein n=1 Tax=Phyllotreta striolata TaxID=444603 RepID=A0A9N9TL95_PHYSR|nr:unnamed protein product [Phyllotreta striolata]